MGEFLLLITWNLPAQIPNYLLPLMRQNEDGFTIMGYLISGKVVNTNSVH